MKKGKEKKSSILPTKLGVILSQTLHPFVSLALLSAIYSDFNLTPVTQEDGFIEAPPSELEHGVSSLCIHADKEIVRPGFLLFDSDAFVLNYKLFHR